MGAGALPAFICTIRHCATVLEHFAVLTTVIPSRRSCEEATGAREQFGTIAPDYGSVSRT
jgi:hypothetical protein